MVVYPFLALAESLYFHKPPTLKAGHPRKSKHQVKRRAPRVPRVPREMTRRVPREAQPKVMERMARAKLRHLDKDTRCSTSTKHLQNAPENAALTKRTNMFTIPYPGQLRIQLDIFKIELNDL